MKAIKIFIITFIITFLLMVILDLPPVKKYIKIQTKKAVIMNLGIRHLTKPQGIES